MHVFLWWLHSYGTMYRRLVFSFRSRLQSSTNIIIMAVIRHSPHGMPYGFVRIYLFFLVFYSSAAKVSG